MQQSAYNSRKITKRDMVIDYKTKNLRGTGTLRCRYILVVALVERKKFLSGRAARGSKYLSIIQEDKYLQIRISHKTDSILLKV
jgi:hypothetical protein